MPHGPLLRRREQIQGALHPILSQYFGWMLDEGSEPRDEAISRKHLRTEDLQIPEIRVEVLPSFLPQWYLRLPMNNRAMNSG